MFKYIFKAMLKLNSISVEMSKYFLILEIHGQLI